MAKKKNTQGKKTVEFFENLEEKTIQSEQFVEKNAKAISAIVGVVILAIIGFFVYQQFIVEPRNQEATQQFLSAENLLAKGNDSLALGGENTAVPGFIGTYKQYSGTHAGKLAAYNAAVLQFKNGKYQEAYDLMSDFESDNAILVAVKYGLMGDAKANLKKGDEALALFEKAINATKDPFTQYFYTRKAGLLALALNKKEVAKGYFTKIFSDYQYYDRGSSEAYYGLLNIK